MLAGLLGNWLLRKTAVGQQVRSSESALIDDLVTLNAQHRDDCKYWQSQFHEANQALAISLANEKILQSKLDHANSLLEHERARTVKLKGRIPKTMCTHKTPEHTTTLEDDTSSVEFDLPDGSVVVAADTPVERRHARNRK